MDITDISLRNPYLVTIGVLFVLLGAVYAGLFMPADLFPDTVPPQTAVITSWPGASQGEVAAAVTRPLERELVELDGIREISSTTRDEVSSINVEFHYYRDDSLVASEVSNVIDQVRGELPAGAADPEVHTITDVTNQLLTLSLRPQPDSPKKLPDVRLLAENDIRDFLLQVDGVGDVEVFGGHQPQVKVELDRDAVREYGLSFSKVAERVAASNINLPGGFLTGEAGEFIVESDHRYRVPSQVETIIVGGDEEQRISLGDLAEVSYSYSDNRSLYRGNGETGIGINVMRLEEAASVTTIRNVKDAVAELRRDYGDIDFEITTDEEPIINVNIRGMYLSLLSAMLMTTVVVFLFIYDFRSSLLVGFSILLSFSAAFTFMNFTPWTLNMVTLSALIIATGMVVDAAIIMVENIVRHYQDGDLEALEAVRVGASEVAFDVFAGMTTTVIVLIPIMYVGGYPQQVLRPLSVVLSVTLIASWLASVTVIPLLLRKFLATTGHHNRVERIVSKLYSGLDQKLVNFYLALVKGALRHKKKLLLGLLILALFTAGFTVQFTGRDLMPPFDTGIFFVHFEFPPSHDIDRVESVVERMEEEIIAEPVVEQTSTVIGSEPGRVSFGEGGQTTQQGSIEVTLVPRNRRDTDIWTYMSRWREEFNQYPELLNLGLVEYGATPFATTVAPVELRLRGRRDELLDRAAEDILAELREVDEVTDLRRDWYRAQIKHNLQPREWKTARHGLTPGDVANFINAVVRGRRAGDLDLQDFDDIPLQVEYATDRYLSRPKQLLDLTLPVDGRPLPLRSLVDLEQRREKTVETRRDLQRTVSVLGVNHRLPVSQTTDAVTARLDEVDYETPPGVELEVAGTIADMNETMSRLGPALLVGLALLYLFLSAVFKDWLHPLTLMAVIPLSLLGAFPALLLFNKPMSMPAMMGFVLMNGTVVNDAILMLTFILEERKSGSSTTTAVEQGVRLRMRPILMTTVSTVVGFSPLIFEWAVGLERMSPLGIVAGAGLITGTFLTLVIVPMVYAIFEDLRSDSARS